MKGEKVEDEWCKSVETGDNTGENYEIMNKVGNTGKWMKKVENFSQR